MRSVLNKEIPLFSRFALIGASGYVINLLVFALCVKMGLYYALAAPLAFLAANLNNYALNRSWTFNVGFLAPAKTWLSSWMQFLAVGLIALVFNIGALTALVEIFSMNAVLSQAIAILVATPMNYIGNRFWTFR